MSGTEATTTIHVHTHAPINPEYLTAPSQCTTECSVAFSKPASHTIPVRGGQNGDVGRAASIKLISQSVTTTPPVVWPNKTLEISCHSWIIFFSREFLQQTSREEARLSATAPSLSFPTSHFWVPEGSAVSRFEMVFVDGGVKVSFIHQKRDGLPAATTTNQHPSSSPPLPSWPAPD